MLSVRAAGNFAIHPAGAHFQEIEPPASLKAKDAKENILESRERAAFQKDCHSLTGDKKIAARREAF
ncbi:hypothetical protein SAMN05660653_01620 [Desulfonatronum thiosulfatophilum]|uniref:Uncharacterized protein n=2 Tax=Desulfonatronum thiosulfatophilum TaxID=617002 RepID=A0A1G6CLI8_9BACT|nr:hypothetical protein SAMN05660653_01620 [Desulfonatronum thiosulfatophilum]